MKTTKTEPTNRVRFHGCMLKPDNREAVKRFNKLPQFRSEGAVMDAGIELLRDKLEPKK